MAQAKLDHETSMRRFATVVVTEAESAARAHDELSVHLARDERCVDVGAPCPVGPAEDYETTAIHLEADGEIVVTVPAPLRSRPTLQVKLLRRSQKLDRRDIE